MNVCNAMLSAFLTGMAGAAGVAVVLFLLTLIVARLTGRSLFGRGTRPPATRHPRTP